MISQKINQTASVKEKFQIQVEEMRKQTFKPFRLQKCTSHLLPKQLLCLNPKCKYFKQFICNDCQHCNHHLFRVNKIVPILTQWAFKEYDEIQKQNHKLTEQWKIVSQNIKYCLDIFQELLKIIDNHLKSKIYAPARFIDITSVLYGMFFHDLNNASPDLFVKNLIQLQNKYHLFGENEDVRPENKQNQFWTNIHCQSLENEKKQRLLQATKANEKSKRFSQKALVFSQTLSQLIESKIHQQQHKKNINQIKLKNQICLKDILIGNLNSSLSQSTTILNQQLQLQSSSLSNNLSQMLQHIETFNMQLSSKDTSKLLNSKCNNFEKELSHIGKLKNLKQLKVNNKNGKIHHNMWYCIVGYFEILKFLKDLKLTLTQQDLPFLTTLFQQKQKAVRQVDSLTLTITDQKQLDLNKVLQFINTLQLKRLNLNLSRNNLEFKKVNNFINKLRVYTSLSQLPLIQCKVLLAANKITHLDQKILLEKTFKMKCKDIKINQLML